MSDASKPGRLPRSNWTRRIGLGRMFARGLETWEYGDAGGEVRTFEVDVRVGKALDVIALKGTSLAEIRRYAAFLKETARRLYGAGDLVRLTECPCCATPTDDAAETATILGVIYRRCAICDHVFVGTQPPPAALLDVFVESDDHASAYTDRAAAELRLEQVVAPKLEWVLDVYRRRYRRQPTSLLDVGAGGGHFVALARRAGLKAEGYEISRASRRFAKHVFDLELRGEDFVHADDGLERFDIVTFWGLLEYTPEPRRFVNAARRRLEAREGLLVVEVPRIDCLGTAVQRVCHDSVARHLDPTSHVNCFSDASLATMLLRAGFEPAAAWYFGMDGYELLTQIALRVDDDRLLERAGDLLPALQAVLDGGRLCDDVIVAAVPRS